MPRWLSEWEGGFLGSMLGHELKLNESGSDHPNQRVRTADTSHIIPDTTSHPSLLDDIRADSPPHGVQGASCLTVEATMSHVQAEARSVGRRNASKRAEVRSCMEETDDLSTR
jgi:hypothetical protein